MGSSVGGAFVPKKGYTRTGATDIGGIYLSKRNLISGVGATRFLKPSESGSICLFDRAAGIVYTLPTPQVGLWYEFDYTVTITSNSATIISDASTTFISGTIANAKASDGTTFTGQGNGTTHIKIASNGSTTGGVLGGHVRVECIGATLWLAYGFVQGSSTLASPFST